MIPRKRTPSVRKTDYGWPSETVFNPLQRSLDEEVQDMSFGINFFYSTEEFRCKRVILATSVLEFSVTLLI